MDRKVFGLPVASAAMLFASSAMAVPSLQVGDGAEGRAETTMRH